MASSSTISPNFATERFSLCISLSNIQLIILILGLLEFLLFHLLTAGKTFHALLSALRPNPPPPAAAPPPKKLRSEPSLSGGDAAVVLKSLGMLAAAVDGGELGEIFEEENFSLGEVKEAFDVFDEDRDGFIDEKEMQRVVCSLGFEEGLEIENCRRMIALGDEDGDGRIDFDEFVMFMERSLC